jgi:hypothetical protein
LSQQQTQRSQKKAHRTHKTHIIKEEMHHISKESSYGFNIISDVLFGTRIYLNEEEEEDGEEIYPF